MKAWNDRDGPFHSEGDSRWTRPAISVGTAGLVLASACCLLRLTRSGRFLLRRIAHSLSDDLTSDEISVTYGRQRFAPMYINYDGYATYSMTFKPKAKVRLMPAAKINCQRTRGYVKIGAGSQYWLAKYYLILRSRNQEDYGCEQHAEEN